MKQKKRIQSDLLPSTTVKLCITRWAACLKQIKLPATTESGDFMASGSDDLFGGMFDFNGDGKTDLGEEFIAFEMFEEMTKETDDEWDVKTHKIRRPSETIRDYYDDFRSNAVMMSVMPPINEDVTEEEYKIIKRTFIGNCLGSILLALVTCFVPAAFAYAAVASHDPRNSASGFVTAFFVIAGIVIIGVVLKEIAKNLAKSYRKLQQAKKIRKNCVDRRAGKTD